MHVFVWSDIEKYLQRGADVVLQRYMEKHVGWDADMFLSDIEQYVERFQIFVLSDIDE